MHGGSVIAESEGEGKGSTFTLRIPMMISRAASEIPAPAGGGAAQGAGSLVALREVSILVIDDDQDARDLIATTLRHAGCNRVLRRQCSRSA